MQIGKLFLNSAVVVLILGIFSDASEHLLGEDTEQLPCLVQALIDCTLFVETL